MILVWFEVVIDEQQFTARQLNKKIFHSPQKKPRTIYLPYQQTYTKTMRIEKRVNIHL